MTSLTLPTFGYHLIIGVVLPYLDTGRGEVFLLASLSLYASVFVPVGVRPHFRVYLSFFSFDSIKITRS
jgi:hypothetical protein